jgi:pyruvate/2-oxoglutarate dehydrogenase complex dihydrolipoamide acyltransferase (E2) component
LVEWKLKVGEDMLPQLCEVESDKAVVDYEIQDDAILAEIFQTTHTGHSGWHRLGSISYREDVIPKPYQPKKNQKETTTLKEKTQRC